MTAISSMDRWPRGDGRRRERPPEGGGKPAPEAPVFEIVHHVNGRLRLRIPRLAHDAEFAQRLEALVIELPTVERVRMNARSRSMLVHFERHGSGHPGDSQAIVPQLVKCIQIASGATVDSPPTSVVTEAAGPRIGAAKRLALPAIGLGLGAGVVGNLALPGLLVGGVVLSSAIPVFKRTLERTKEAKRPTVDSLNAATILLFAAQGSYLGAAVGVAVAEGSAVLRDWTVRHHRHANLDLLQSQKRTMLVERDGQREQVLWEDVVPGDVILVHPGGQIVVDGVVLNGSAAVDEHRVTGDAVLAQLQAGDRVRAATVVVEGHLRIQAERVGRDTHVATEMASVNSVVSPDKRVSDHGRSLGDPATLPTIATAGAVLATSGSVARATGILVLDLGTGMRASAPVAVLAAQTRAARSGILIRNGRALENLAQIDVIAFDKTATLTEGKSRVVHAQTLGAGVQLGELLALAASAEQDVDHPIAAAIVRHAQQEGVQLLARTAWHYRVGLGVEAEIDGQVVHVGNHSLMEQLGIDVAGVAEQFATRPSEPTTRVYVAQGTDLLGIIHCAHQVRPESAAAIAGMQSAGIIPVMLSGDSRPVTQATAQSVGIGPKGVHAELTPQGKVAVLQELQGRRMKVGFVGDGINDAAAMAHADVSFALGSSTGLAREAADIVLLENDLRDLVATVALARHTMGILEQNTRLVFLPNVGAIAYGALFALNPAVSVAINNSSALVATLNSLRSLRLPRKSL